MDGGGSLCPACLEWAGPLIEASVRMIREYKKLLRKEIATLRSNCNSLALSTFGTTEFSLCYTKAISAANRVFAAEMGRLLLEKEDDNQESKNLTPEDSLLELIDIL